MELDKAKTFILDLLRKNLKPNLYYHNIEHTIDVYQSAQRIAQLEGINGPQGILLETAALFHDSGMINTYQNHEEASTEITHQFLPQFGYSLEQIEIINQMIRTTKLPQNARSILEKILCDADLDYLGRKDFFMISHRLHMEWYLIGNPMTLLEWYQSQQVFLTQHEFFTQGAKQTRQDQKQNNLAQVRELLNGASKA